MNMLTIYKEWQQEEKRKAISRLSDFESYR